MKLILTAYKEKILILLFQNNRLQSLQVADPAAILGNIYLGRVQRVLPGLNAAFIDIAKDRSCFLPQAGQWHLKGNDDLPVQVITEAGKNKPPAVSAELTMNGRYCIVMAQNQKSGLAFSGKLPLTKKKKLREQLSGQPHLFASYQVIIRTNAGELDDAAPLVEELTQLTGELDELLGSAPHRTAPCLLRKETDGYLKAVRDIPTAEYHEIVTDCPDIYETLKNIYGPEAVRFYQDDLLTLSKLYSVGTHLQNALAARVWLNSGAFLVIEPTEALTVIDVNTGKNDNKAKGPSFLPVNQAAAAEIARQLRIRNLAGIIIIDFISMTNAADNETLLHYLRELVKNDPVKTTVVDMTPLGLVELTRKKVNKVLAEALK